MVTKAESQGLAELAEADRTNRAPRTAGQVGLAAAGFILFDYVVRGLLKVDLDPFSDSEELPLVVQGAVTTLGAYFVALWWNRKSGPAVNEPPAPIGPADS